MIIYTYNFLVMFSNGGSVIHFLPIIGHIIKNKNFLHEVNEIYVNFINFTYRLVEILVSKHSIFKSYFSIFF